VAKLKVNMTLAMTKETEDKLKQFISTFTEKVQKRVFRGAVKKASQAFADNMQKHVPVGTGKHGNDEGVSGHYKDTVAFKVKAYRNFGATLGIIGYRSKQNPLATLMERSNFLTSPRMTRRESASGRVRVPKPLIRKRTVKQRADGSHRTVYEPTQKFSLRSTGSRELASQGPFRKQSGRFRKGDEGHSTGDFPKSKQPYAPIGKAYAAMRETCRNILLNETKAGLDRAFARGAS
jgi:hypothetical protein